jgi:hypothetical protein
LKFLNTFAKEKEQMAYLTIILAVLTRFIPHPWDFSPVYGALLFGGATIKKRHSIWFSALTLGVSDVVLTKFIYQFNLGWDELIQVAAFVSIAMIGWILKKHFSVVRLGFACLAAPLSFYLISDFGVWLGYGSYPHTWNGLLACYIAAIPYQGRIIPSTALFAVLLFGTQQIYIWQANRKKHLHAFIG